MILEQQRLLFPTNDRVYHSLIELYKKLKQEDYIVGVRRDYTKTTTVKTVMSLSQSRLWEQANHLLNQGLEAIVAQDTSLDLSTDLKCANEYDQLVWEELQIEGVKYGGQYDVFPLLYDQK